MGQNSCQPARGCCQNRRRAGTWSRDRRKVEEGSAERGAGARLRGCDRGTGRERVVSGPMRVSGVRLRPVRRRLVCGSRRTSAPFKNRGRSLARPFPHHFARDRAPGRIPRGAAVEVEQGPQLQVGDATRDQTQRDRPPPSTAFEVRSPKKTSGPLFHSPAVPLPPYDAPSKHTTLGTCSALRGTLCRSACQYRHIGCTSLRVITNSGSNARVFHRARGSHTDG